MCIRDRYQRRVHGESNKKTTKMKVFVCILIALFAVSSLQQVSPVKSFLTGLINGAYLEANQKIIGLMTDELDLANVAVALSKMASEDRVQRIAGIEQLYATLYAYAGKTYKTIDLDINLKFVYNYTLTILSNQRDFFARAEKSLADPRTDVFPRIAYAANFAKAGDFYNAGTNLGWTINQLVKSGPPLPTPNLTTEQQVKSTVRKYVKKLFIKARDIVFPIIM
eukprot:TRINITY_DN807_c0_g2_i1.p1 TRINITY_DN807_c0_g2~~TRINITY_DN807_c0_g2_i1.p1  ORF type:complete len:224 (+),score=60.05 TRINITY_DN807_c0_g2_i1:65-736(+)